MTDEPPAEISLVSELPGASGALGGTITEQDTDLLLKRPPRPGMGDRMEPNETLPRVVFGG